MAQRAEKTSVRSWKMKKSDYKTKTNFLKKTFYLKKGLNQFHKLFTTDKQYIQNI